MSSVLALFGKKFLKLKIEAKMKNLDIKERLALLC